MRLFVTVKTRAKEDRVVCIDDAHYQISVRVLPVKGMANIAVQKALARYLKLPVQSLVLRTGATGRRKVFEVAQQ